MKIYKDIEDFKTIKEMLQTRALTHKDLIAIYQKNQDQSFTTKTFGELKEDTDALGTVLSNMGLKGKKIAITGKNSYDWIVSYFAVTCGLGVVIPLDKQLTETELVKNISRVDIDTILYSGELRDKIDSISEYISVKHYINFNDIKSLIEQGKYLIANGDREYIDTKIDEEVLSALIFTSGTTAEPKIVMQSNKNMMSVVKAGRQMVKFDKNDKYLSVLPLNHTFESVCGLLAPLASGSAITYVNDTNNIAKDIKLVGPTAMTAVPKVAELFYEKISAGIKKQNKEKQVNLIIKVLNLLGKYGYPAKRFAFHQIHDQFGGNLRLLILGGAPLKPEITAYFKGLGIQTVQGYGLTECSPLVTLNGDKDFDDTTAGLPTLGTTVLIKDPNEEGIGEILVKGPQVTAGYYNDEKATRELFDKEGYLRTGDLGSVSKEGFIKVLGRIKNLIITSNGENVSPEEIEDKFNSVDGVKESLVQQKTTVKGRQQIVATVVLNELIKQKIEECPHMEKEIYEEMLNYLEEKNNELAPYKRAIIDLTINPLERTATQKIKRVYEPDLKTVSE